ncbi:MAG: hypothetical protein QOC58_327, partial [Mycobacterium sp.]|nr:hypothetical protein [Mycobacterium sp.]
GAPASDPGSPVPPVLDDRTQMIPGLGHDAGLSADDGSAPTEPLPAGSALLVVHRGPNAGSRFLLDAPVVTAGRHPDSDILLDDVTVSRRHAEFRLDEDGNWVVADVGSLNGIYVNRQPVDSTVLVNNDEVQIGRFRLVFFTGAATWASPA